MSDFKNDIVAGQTITLRRIHEYDKEFAAEHGFDLGLTVGSPYTVEEVGDTFLDMEGNCPEVNGAQMFTVLDDLGNPNEITEWHLQEA